jgi:hypothetical protein
MNRMRLFLENRIAGSQNENPETFPEVMESAACLSIPVRLSPATHNQNVSFMKRGVVKFGVLAVAVVIANLFFASAAWGLTTITSGNTVNASTIPVNDTVVINAGGTLNMDVSKTFASISTANGGTSSITGSGTVTTGTLTLSAGNGAGNSNTLSISSSTTVICTSITNAGGGNQNEIIGLSGVLKNSGTTGLDVFTCNTGSTVEYNGAAQTVFATTYSNLTLSTSGSKTTTGVTVNGILSMEGTATASVAPTYGTSATLQYNTATARTSGVEWITPFVASGGIIIGNTGTITPGAAKTLNSTAPLTINSSATFADGGLTLTVKGNISNSGTHSGAGKILLTGGSAAHALTGSGGSYGNLELNDPLGATLTGTATITGNLALTGATGDITVTSGVSNTLFMGTGSTSSGVGDVVGRVNRSDSGSYGNPNVIITKAVGNTVSSYDVVLFKGATSKSSSVLRQYDITPNGADISVQTATLRLRYRRSPVDELNGNSETPCTNLQLWKETSNVWVGQGATACSATSDTDRWVELAAVVSFSPWTIAGAGAPTACKLEGFQAARSDDGVMLEWHTGHEVNNIGFNVYRQGSDGEMVKLTKHMVAGSGLMVRKNTEITSGLSYYWSDPDTKKGDNPRYWLEDLDASGQTSWNGPFFINEAATPTRPTPGVKESPGEKGGRGDGNSITINSLNEVNEQDGAYQSSGPEESTAKIRKMKIAAAVQQSDLAGKPAVKISINKEGWYRITQPQLVAAGLSASTDVRKLQLFVDAQEIPIVVGGNNGRGFDPNGYIEFYGQGLDTPSTDTRVYWLIVGSNGRRVNKNNAIGGGNAGGSFQYTVQRKDRLFYRSEIQNGDAENFFGAFVYYQPTNQTLNVTRIAPAANTTLEIAVQGFNAGPHQIQVSLNGAIVGTLSFADRTRQVFTLTAPQALLTEGTNTVSLQALAGSSDFSFVDYIKLTYAHKFEADNNALKFTAPGSSVVTLSGFTGSNIRVVDVTDPRSVMELVGKTTQVNGASSITVTTPSGGTRTLLAFVDSKQAAKVAANKPSSLRQSSNQADLVIVGAGDFSASLQSLKTLRQGQGIQTMLVDVEDVYDEFSFGQKSPSALKDFLSYARTNWKKSPGYVLLGGMASFDPRNYMALGNTDLVPTKIVMTEHLETASDDWFVDFNNDGMPEMALGRLPARNADEAARMVQKILNYDQAPASGAGVLLVADVNKGFDFEHNNDLLKAIVPGTTAVQDIRRASDPQAKQNLLLALNQGKKLVNYTGHGSVDLWEASLLTSTDAAGLANAQKLSLVVAMTCLNGYFFDERFESLAHALINAQNGGAVAVWSSTGLTEPEPQSLADQELFRQLFAGASVRLGDAALKAKAVITDSDVRRTWVLIGDPTMRFKR